MDDEPSSYARRFVQRARVAQLVSPCYLMEHVGPEEDRFVCHRHEDRRATVLALVFDEADEDEFGCFEYEENKHRALHVGLCDGCRAAWNCALFLNDLRMHAEAEAA